MKGISTSKMLSSFSDSKKNDNLYAEYVDQYKRSAWDKFDQGDIINILQKLGYSGDHEGMCAGITQMWAQSVLCGEEDKFIGRLLFIKDHNDKMPHDYNINNEISVIQKKIKKYESAEDKKQLDRLLEVKALCDGIELFQNAELYESIFGQYLLYNKIEKISSLIGSIELEKHGGIASIYSEVDIVDQQNLHKDVTNYFNALANVLRNHEASNTLPITFTSMDHRLGLRYFGRDEKSGEDVWLLADPNRIPPKKILTSDLSRKLNKSLFSLSEKFCPSFHINILTTGDKVDSLNDLKNELQQFYKSNHNKDKNIAACILDKNSNGELSRMAAMYDDDKAINYLAKYGGCIAKKNNNGYAPVHVASQFNSGKVIKALANANVDLNFPAGNYWTPARLAASDGATDAIRELAKANVVFDQSVLNKSLGTERWETALVITLMMPPENLDSRSVSESEFKKISDELTTYLERMTNESEKSELLQEIYDKKNALGVLFRPSAGVVLHPALKAVQQERRAERAYAYAKQAENDNDLETAYKYYQQAINLNHAGAKNRYGLLYLDSDTPKKQQHGFKLIKEAAESGYALAQANLGKLYEKGIVVEKDLNAAKKWYAESIANGNKKAITYLDGIEASIQQAKQDVALIDRFLAKLEQVGGVSIEYDAKLKGYHVYKAIKSHDSVSVINDVLKTFNIKCYSTWSVSHGTSLLIKRADIAPLDKSEMIAIVRKVRESNEGIVLQTKEDNKPELPRRRK